MSPSGATARLWHSDLFRSYGLRAAPGLRVRGTIDRIEGDTYIVSTRGGGQVQVKLADSSLVVAVTKAALADIKPASYVGVSGMPQRDGSQKALEVSSPRPCVGWATVTAPGTCSHRAQ